MSHLSLASRYRPQLFADVGGQDLVTAALSRVCAADTPAPAYLLSGTRGVGKTTVARIFAKALNCERGPADEPCNECPQCRKITEGRHVDVCEIDGASNNRVEDARSLRENIGYAPMEGRYKVFIIDEAHMLSNSAFNALLKTLEEPPGRVVFIFATTEAHKFPVTIVSRCQHFVFSHLSEDTLAGHLEKILKLENVTADPEAVRILARRAAGSVRDSLSLLDQVLALGGGELTAARAREVLGLAGREFLEKLFDALAQGDLAGIIALCRQILQRGLDIGYFLRDLSANLRNLFLVREAGVKIAPALGISAGEQSFLERQAKAFSAAHLHGAWQMALSGQREITQSQEPGAALEMLLLNMALLPRLLPVEKSGEQQGWQPGNSSAAKNDSPKNGADNAAAQTKPVGEIGPLSSQAPRETPQDACQPVVPLQTVSAHVVDHSVFDWRKFREYCGERQKNGLESPPAGILACLVGNFVNGRVELETCSASAFDSAQKNLPLIRQALEEWLGKNIEVQLCSPGEKRPENEIRAELENNPELQPCMEILKAQITRCREIGKGESNA